MKIGPRGVRRAFACALGVASALIITQAPGASAADVSPLTSCSTGYVCFYSQENYGGTPCKWQSDDSNWEASPGVCSWAATKNVRSMYNQGTSGEAVFYYSKPNHDGYLGALDQYQGRNVNLHIQSHYWV